MSDRVIELASWRRQVLADGVVLHAPAHDARIRIRPRMHSRHLCAIVSEVLDALGVVARTAPRGRRFVTEQGELGAIARSTVTRSGASDLELAVAVVGANPSFCVDGVGEVGSDIADLVEALAVRCGTGRGTARATMFEYVPPRTWHGLRRDAVSVWLHPDCPRSTTRISVFDARLLTTSPAERLHRVLYMRTDEQPLDEGRDPVLVESDFGLHGRLRAIQTIDPMGQARVRVAAALGDHRFVYQALLEAPAEDLEAVAVFTKLIRSFRPLPALPDIGDDSFAHCID